MNLQKVLQIVARLLQKHSNRLNYTKLIKMLYIADREALSRWDASITGDNYASLKNGPIVSQIYNLIMGHYPDRGAQLQWNMNFSRVDYDLVASASGLIATDELSDREEALLDEIEQRYHDWPFGRLIDLTHKAALFPEWEDPGSSSIPIPLKKILEKLGRSDEEIAEILSDEAAFQKDQQPPPSGCI